MIKLLMVLFTVLFLQNNSFAQDGKPYKILKNWLGDWKGTMKMSYTHGTEHSIPVELKISETDTARVWAWKIFSGTGENKEVTSYLLREVDFQKGLFILEKENSVQIDFYSYDFNTFYNNYSENGVLITSQYRLQDNKIYMEINSSDMNSINTLPQTDNDSTFIHSYPLKVIRIAELSKE